MPEQPDASRPGLAASGGPSERRRVSDRRPERSVAEEILSRAAALFADRGYHAVGIRDLADAVGLSTSTLYHYYATKQDILFAIVSGFLGEFTERLVSGLRDASMSPRGRLERAVAEHLRITATRREEMLGGSPILNALSPEQRASVTVLRREYRDALRDVIVEGVAAGDFDVTDPMLTAMAVLDMLDGIRSWYHLDGPLSLPELTAHYRVLALALCRAGGVA